MRVDYNKENNCVLLKPDTQNEISFLESLLDGVKMYETPYGLVIKKKE
jgi:hypothetical protein